MTADDLKQLGVVDEVLAEPPGGAHHSHDEAARLVGAAVARHLSELALLSREELLEQRYQKYRAIGQFTENLTALPPAS